MIIGSNWDSFPALSMASEIAKIDDVPVCLKEFKTEDEAVQHAIHCQRDCRNITDSDIARCVEVVDKRKEIKRDDGGKFTVCSSEPAAESVDCYCGVCGEEFMNTPPLGIKFQRLKKNKSHSGDAT